MSLWKFFKKWESPISILMYLVRQMDKSNKKLMKFAENLFLESVATESGFKNNKWLGSNLFRISHNMSKVQMTVTIGGGP